MSTTTKLLLVLIIIFGITIYVLKAFRIYIPILFKRFIQPIYLISFKKGIGAQVIVTDD